MNIRYFLTGIFLAAVIVASVYFFNKSHGLVLPAASSHSFAHSLGPEQAPVQIEEYSDFQCPACQKAEAPLRKIRSDYPDQIRFTFYHFPLEGHEWSGLAHQAAECAASSGKFLEYHDKIYDEQAIWSGAANPPQMFLEYARDLGLDLDSFAACLSDQKIKRRILLDKNRGEGLKVQSTPTFFINGERFVGPVELENKGKARIEALLGKPKSEANMSVLPEKTV